MKFDRYRSASDIEVQGMQVKIPENKVTPINYIIIATQLQRALLGNLLGHSLEASGMNCKLWGQYIEFPQSCRQYNDLPLFIH